MSFFIKKMYNTSHKKYHPNIESLPSSVVPKSVLSAIAEPSSINTRCKESKTANKHARATIGYSSNLKTEPITNITSQFVTQLNSLITPLVSFILTLLNMLLSGSSISPYYVLSSLNTKLKTSVLVLISQLLL